MIKCTYFGRLLKPLLFTLLISCFGLLGNFSNATNYQIGLDKYVSTVDNQYELGVLKGGGVLTNLLGTSKSVFAVNENILFWWATNGLPYFYGGGTQHLGQGFFKNYFVCDVMTGSASPSFSNCSKQVISTDILKGFFSKVVVGDYFSYDYGYGTDNYGRWGEFYHICFSSNEIGQSLCFSPGDDCNYNINQCSVNLENSQNLSNITFGNISRNWLSYAPGQYGYGGNFDNSEGNIDIDLNNSLTGDYVYTNCTYGEVIQELENNGFNKYMCFGGLDNFDLYDSSINYSPIPGTGLRLSQILSYSSAWDTPLEWFQFWDGLYQDRYNNSYNSMWESYPAVYRTWFDIYYQYGRNLNKNFDWVREYCIMTVDLDLDETAIYKGQFFKGVCDTVIDKKINSSYYVGSGNSAVGTNWNGIGNIGSGSEVVVSNDPAKFMQDYFNIIKSNIPSRYDLGGGVLPLYIITFMLAIILFRFISH